MAKYSNIVLVIVMLVFLQAFLAFATSFSNFTDQQSLIAFKSEIKIDPEDILSTNWTEDANFCDWHGVTCARRIQRVTALSLRNMGLVGPISPHIGNLSLLTVLDLGNNSFYGTVIPEISFLSNLKVLYLRKNHLKSAFPDKLSRCQNLEIIDMSYNEIIGVLPENISTLPKLHTLYLSNNNLTGKIPPSIGNITTLQWLSFTLNKLQGYFPRELAFLPKLTVLSVSGNELMGSIPEALFNISTLEVLSLGVNRFTGDLPSEIGSQLPNLTKLFLNANQFTGNIPDHLHNASRLSLLNLALNQFTGTLPPSLPMSLKFFNVMANHLEGEILEDTIASLTNLTHLGLSNNSFSGTISSIIKGKELLQTLYLEYNEFQGPIPEQICLLRNLGEIFLGHNKIYGSIPDCIGNLSRLQQLSLDVNELNSRLPLSLWNLDNLLYLNLSSNSLHGDLGENLRGMISLDALDLSRNKLSGKIPASVGSFQSLTFLDFSRNSFAGTVPESLGKLKSLVYLDLSSNNLSGHIPKSLEELSYLKFLNMSYNTLSGEVPSEGPFMNFTTQAFVGNPELCGESVSKSCQVHSSKKSRGKLFPLVYILPIVVLVGMVAIIVLYFYITCKRSGNKSSEKQDNSLQGHKMVSYQELFRATNGFSEANFLGEGGFGRVYKGILADGEIVAVKLLNLTIDGSLKSFDAECKVLRTVRHRNLVKVISTCTNIDLRALVLGYIPNGSLEKWLYSHNYCLDFIQRVSIMLDVAIALEYLHCGLSEPVIHCDLKPSNVLLDKDMVAHVGDFGISKVLATNKTETQTSTFGTFGYIAPEYGTEGIVSIKGDTYSYGIMLLETFTRKRPTDEMFSEELSLRQWVSASFPYKINIVADNNLLNMDDISLQNNLVAVLELGLACSRDIPDERKEIKDVVTVLSKIKSQIAAK